MQLVPPLAYIIDVKSNAERRLAQILDRLPSEPGDVAFHSVHLPEHEYKRMSEIDFLIVWKGAVLVVEVKGGRIRQEGGLWIFTDRFGTDHTRRESPWEQGRSAMFALRARVEAATRESRYEFATVVVTPDQDFPDSVEWAPWEHVGRAKFSLEGLTQTLDAAARKARGGRSIAQMPPPKALKTFVRPDFDRVVPLGELGREIAARMAELASEQIDVLEALEGNARVLVEGGAGSGKTLLAVEAARRAASNGQKVLFACSSPAIVGLVGPVMKDAGVVAATFTDLPSGLFDLIVVDEGQDTANVDDLAALEKRLEGGLENGSWWYFADPNNQAQVAGSFDPDAYSVLKEAGFTYRLRKNHRNTAAVVDVVQAQLGADLGTPLIGAGPAVEFPRIQSVEDIPAAIDRRLSALRDQGVAPEDIEVVSLALDISTSQALKLDSSSSNKVSRVAMAGHTRLWTAAEIKGLEGDHILVVDLPTSPADGWISALYVAMTRARVSLWIALGPETRTFMERLAINRIQVGAGVGLD